ncbi:hypothetical protein [Atlantibacter sp.]|uniref:hypothetical protein n=1 Tax=Atlantibacter sp. TaxID=1903473 RepID=UPI0028AEFBFE|nr:hypothetical protein [Atlantibacter sp.]
MNKNMLVGLLGVAALFTVFSNSAAQRHDVKHYAQSSHHPAGNGMKTLHVHKLGIDFKRGADGIGWINGSPASNDENTADASVYTAGLITVLVYKNGKINAMEDGKFLGRMN